MAVTKVKLKEKKSRRHEVCFFKTADGKTLWVEHFDNGIAFVKPIAGRTIREFAEILEGCVHKDSNFVRELLKVLEYPKDTPFFGFLFHHNGVTFFVRKENATADKICAAWEAAYKSGSNFAEFD